MRILVTGGGGFIGSHVVDIYLRHGHQVAVVDNLSTGSRKNLNSKARFFRVDIRHNHHLERVFQKFKPEIINHHAAQAEVRKSIQKPGLDASINIIGGLNLLNLAVKYRVGKIIYSNTGGALYGELPTRHLPAKEDTPIHPISPYGLSKYTFERYLEIYARLFRLNFLSFRYANIYGPRQSPTGEAGVVAIFSGLMLKNQRPKIFGTGRQTRDYLYVADVARANLLALEKGKNSFVNLGTGRETSVLEIFRLIAKEVGWKGKPRFQSAIPGELKRAAEDISLAKRLLGWQPSVPLALGIKKTVAYIRRHYD